MRVQWYLRIPGLLEVGQRRSDSASRIEMAKVIIHPSSFNSYGEEERGEEIKK